MGTDGSAAGQRGPIVMKQVWQEIDRLYKLGCRRFFLSQADWLQLEREIDFRTPQDVDPNRYYLEQQGLLEPRVPRVPRPFVNLSWKGCPIIWTDYLEDL